MDGRVSRTEESWRPGHPHRWNEKYPMIYKSWDHHWVDLSGFYKYPPEIRRAIYTTNAVESLNYQLRQVTKNRSSFSTDDAILKILYLAIRNASKRWTMPIRDWGAALNQFAIEFGNERVPFK
ncbi:MAG: transposase [Treponema sp.]|nr:transposase [Treponema sp.]